MKTIRVAAAIIQSGRYVYATQRGYGPYKDGWEFPGGKIEPGETPQQALIREIREELDTEIAVGDKLTTVEYDYPEFHLSMDCFLCSIRSGNPVLKEHEAAKWLSADEMDSVAWLPADRIAADRLRDSFGTYFSSEVSRKDTIQTDG
jgi:8-oxo-dGTP diphosphatase